jgi:hypothetical protein
METPSVDGALCLNLSLCERVRIGLRARRDGAEKVNKKTNKRRNAEKEHGPSEQVSQFGVDVEWP